MTFTTTSGVMEPAREPEKALAVPPIAKGVRQYMVWHTLGIAYRRESIRLRDGQFAKNAALGPSTMASLTNAGDCMRTTAVAVIGIRLSA